MSVLRNPHLFDLSPSRVAWAVAGLVVVVVGRASAPPLLELPFVLVGALVATRGRAWPWVLGNLVILALVLLAMLALASTEL